MKQGDVQWLVFAANGEWLGIVRGQNRAAARAAATKEYPDFDHIKPA